MIVIKSNSDILNLLREFTITKNKNTWFGMSRYNKVRSIKTQENILFLLTDPKSKIIKINCMKQKTKIFKPFKNLKVVF